MSKAFRKFRPIDDPASLLLVKVAALSVLELPFKVPLYLFGLRSSQHRRLKDKGLMLLGARCGLAGGLSDLLPHLFVCGHGDRSIGIPEEEALLE